MIEVCIALLMLQESFFLIVIGLDLHYVFNYSHNESGVSFG